MIAIRTTAMSPKITGNIEPGRRRLVIELAPRTSASGNFGAASMGDFDAASVVVGVEAALVAGWGIGSGLVIDCSPPTGGASDFKMDLSVLDGRLLLLLLPASRAAEKAPSGSNPYIFFFFSSEMGDWPLTVAAVVMKNKIKARMTGPFVSIPIGFNPSLSRRRFATVASQPLHC